MAFLVKHTWKDAQGLEIELQDWVGTEAEASTLLQTLDAASNALLVKAELHTPVPLQTIINNDATNNNVETAAAKAVVTFRGADAGSLAQPFDEVTLEIPAPIGTLINGLTGDASNADLLALAGEILSEHGVTMSSISAIKYKRG